MKISRNYIIVYSVIILLTASFTVFLLLYQLTDPNFPIWLTGTGIFFWIVSIFSFLWNFKSLKIEQDKICLNRLVLPDIELSFQEIEEIEETDFRYTGASSTSTVYKGYHLTIKTSDRKIKTSSLNEPDYNLLRETLKMRLGHKVKLTGDYRGETLNWFLLAIMLIPSIYLVIKIIEKITLSE